MGQTNIQKIRSSLVYLTENSLIEIQQAQRFIKDYISSGEKIKDINYFIQSQSPELFLKYFINATYQPPRRKPAKENCKERAKLQEKERKSQQIWNFTHRLLKDLTKKYMDPMLEISTLKENIRNFLVAQLSVDSYKYYYFHNGLLKETNSKILYLYESSVDNPIFLYCKNYFSHGMKDGFNKICSELYPNTFHYQFMVQDIEKKELKIFLLEINPHTWKYSGQPEESRSLKQVLSPLCLKLCKDIPLIFEAQISENQHFYRNWLTKLSMDLIETIVLLQYRKIEQKERKDQCFQEFENENWGQIEGKMRQIKWSILKKIRKWRKIILQRRDIFMLSYNNKQLQFLFTDSLKEYQKVVKNKNISYFEKYVGEISDKKISQKIEGIYNKQTDSRKVFWKDIQIYFTPGWCPELKSMIIVGSLDSSQAVNQEPRKPLVEVEVLNMAQRKKSKFDLEPSTKKQRQLVKYYINNENQKVINNTNTQIIKRKNNIKLPKLNKQLSSSFSEQELDLDNLNINFLLFTKAQLNQVVIRLFSKLPYFRKLPHQNGQFLSFLNNVALGYGEHQNHFHNFSHAVNVTHTAYLLCNLKKNHEILSEFQRFAIVFSALCHDIGHTGFTNAFEIARESPIALAYNDNSPLENYHISKAFQILRKKQNNFLSSLTKDDYVSFRKIVISSILYTDMKEHFSLLKLFQKIKQNLDKNDDVKIIGGMIVHASDLGGSVRNYEISMSWSMLVNEQFKFQYETEAKLGLPQTPFMKDLDQIKTLSKNEVGFLKNIVLPLYSELYIFYEQTQVKQMLDNIKKNIEEWQRRGQPNKDISS